jgi:hypothetical protein
MFIRFITVILRHSGRGKFAVNDAAAPFRQDGKVNTAIGFDKHLFTHSEEFFCQKRSLFLKQRFSAGDLDRGTVGRSDFVKQTPDRTLLSPLPGISGIAIAASQITSGKPDKKTDFPGVGGFSLHTLESLYYLKHR